MGVYRVLSVQGTFPNGKRARINARCYGESSKFRKGRDYHEYQTGQNLVFTSQWISCWKPEIIILFLIILRMNLPK